MRVEGVEPRRDGVWPGLIAVLLLLALARLAATGLMPLMDTSEARYGDIARQMAERGDWVTPWFRDGSPFWGKPPLAFWLSAIGFKVFGFNEFGARAPHWLLGVATAALVWWQGRQRSRRVAWHATALLAGSALFLLLSGAVLTDIALALANLMVMVGVWRAMGKPQAARVPAAGARSAQALVAVGVAIGLLAKGPVALVLCAVPVLGWALWAGRMRALWQRVAWVRGSVLVAAAVVPWYAMAELRTPGFLSYFIVGEHWHRFLTPGWHGDLYGGAHVRARGTIWLDALVATLPWTVLAPLAWWRVRRDRSDAAAQGARPATDELVYLLAWALMPMVLFTMAGNILWTYVLPGVPAAALALARFTARWPHPRRTDMWLASALAVWLLVLVLLVPGMHRTGTFERRSTAWLVDLLARQPQADAAPLLYLGGEMPFSLSFYANRRALLVTSPQALASAVQCPSTFVATTVKTAKTLVADASQRITTLGASRQHVLLRMDCAAQP